MALIQQMRKPASVLVTLSVLLTSAMTVVFAPRQKGDTANKKIPNEK